MERGALGQHIKQRRQELGMTQRELAARVGMAPGYLGQLESGTKHWPQKYIPALSRELGDSVEDLARIAGLLPPNTTEDVPPRTEPWTLDELIKSMDGGTEIQRAMNLLHEFEIDQYLREFWRSRGYPPGRQFPDFDDEELQRNIDTIRARYNVPDQSEDELFAFIQQSVSKEGDTEPPDPDDSPTE